MSDQISADAVRSAVLGGLEEAFESVHGYFLDKGTSLFETLSQVTAGEASQASASSVGTLAAQVDHATFYLTEAIRFAQEGPGGAHADWAGSWSRTTVTDAEWDDLRANLRSEYSRMQDLVRSNPVWNEMTIGGCIATIAHSAYHLGEIRQALAVIRARQS
ncbi:MAG: hypothetical protein WKF81_09075 [Thermomicrobiales bacterium]